MVSYLLEGKLVEATSIEFSFYIHEMSSTNRTYEGLLCKNGKISLNGIYSREKIGLVVIFLGYLKVRMNLASLY